MNTVNPHAQYLLKRFALLCHKFVLFFSFETDSEHRNLLKAISETDLGVILNNNRKNYKGGTGQQYKQ